MTITGKFAAALGLAVVSSLLATAPAQASVSGSVGNGSAVLYEGCRDWGIPYSLNIDPGVDYWNLELSVKGPDGIETFSDYLYSSDYPSSGTAQVQVCSFEDPGTYTVEAAGEWSDYDTDQDGTYTLPTSTFKVRLPKSRTTIKVVKKPKNRVVITVAVKDERPNGHFPSEYADVKLQAFHGGRWVTANAGNGYTNDDGVARWVYRRTVRTKVRAVMVDDAYQKSVSRVIYVPGK
jgi:hypothetical protein